MTPDLGLMGATNYDVHVVGFCQSLNQHRTLILGLGAEQHGCQSLDFGFIGCISGGGELIRAFHSVELLSLCALAVFCGAFSFP